MVIIDPVVNQSLPVNLTPESRRGGAGHNGTCKSTPSKATLYVRSMSGVGLKGQSQPKASKQGARGAKKKKTFFFFSFHFDA